MAAEQALPWQDILVPAAPTEPWVWLLAALLLLVLLAMLLILSRWWWRRPRRLARRRLGGIRRQLLAGRMESRDALFAVASCLANLPLAEQDRNRLQLRFAPQLPAAADLEAWLHGLERRLGS